MEDRKRKAEEAEAGDNRCLAMIRGSMEFPVKADQFTMVSIETIATFGGFKREMNGGNPAMCRARSRLCAKGAVLCWFPGMEK